MGDQYWCVPQYFNVLKWWIIYPVVLVAYSGYWGTTNQSFGLELRMSIFLIRDMLFVLKYIFTDYIDVLKNIFRLKLSFMVELSFKLFSI